VLSWPPWPSSVHPGLVALHRRDEPRRPASSSPCAAPPRLRHAAPRIPPARVARPPRRPGYLPTRQPSQQGHRPARRLPRRPPLRHHSKHRQATLYRDAVPRVTPRRRDRGGGGQGTSRADVDGAAVTVAELTDGNTGGGAGAKSCRPVSPSSPCVALPRLRRAAPHTTDGNTSEGAGAEPRRPASPLSKRAGALVPNLAGLRRRRLRV
jgi:hypothetical protein